MLRRSRQAAGDTARRTRSNQKVIGGTQIATVEAGAIFAVRSYPACPGLALIALAPLRIGGIAFLTGARPFGADAPTGPCPIAWTARIYALLGIAPGACRSSLDSRRSSVVFERSFAGIVR